MSVIDGSNSIIGDKFSVSNAHEEVLGVCVCQRERESEVKPKAGERSLTQVDKTYRPLHLRLGLAYSDHNEQ